MTITSKLNAITSLQKALKKLPRSFQQDWPESLYFDEINLIIGRALWQIRAEEDKVFDNILRKIAWHHVEQEPDIKGERTTLLSTQANFNGENSVGSASFSQYIFNEIRRYDVAQPDNPPMEPTNWISWLPIIQDLVKTKPKPKDPEHYKLIEKLLSLYHTFFGDDPFSETRVNEEHLRLTEAPIQAVNIITLANQDQENDQNRDKRRDDIIAVVTLLARHPEQPIENPAATYRHWGAQSRFVASFIGIETAAPLQATDTKQQIDTNIYPTGNALLIGPVGAGKTTLLDASQSAFEQQWEVNTFTETGNNNTINEHILKLPTNGIPRALRIVDIPAAYIEQRDQNGAVVAHANPTLTTYVTNNNFESVILMLPYQNDNNNVIPQALNDIQNNDIHIIVTHIDNIQIDGLQPNQLQEAINELQAQQLVVNLPQQHNEVNLLVEQDNLGDDILQNPGLTAAMMAAIQHIPTNELIDANFTNVTVHFAKLPNEINNDNTFDCDTFWININNNRLPPTQDAHTLLHTKFHEQHELIKTNYENLQKSIAAIGAICPMGAEQIAYRRDCFYPEIIKTHTSGIKFITDLKILPKNILSRNMNARATEIFARITTQRKEDIEGLEGIEGIEGIEGLTKFLTKKLGDILETWVGITNNYEDIANNQFNNINEIVRNQITSLRNNEGDINYHPLVGPLKSGCTYKDRELTPEEQALFNALTQQGDVHEIIYGITSNPEADDEQNNETAKQIIELLHDRQETMIKDPFIEWHVAHGQLALNTPLNPEIHRSATIDMTAFRSSVATLIVSISTLLTRTNNYITAIEDETRQALIHNIEDNLRAYFRDNNQGNLNRLINTLETTYQTCVNDNPPIELNAALNANSIIDDIHNQALKLLIKSIENTYHNTPWINNEHREIQIGHCNSVNIIGIDTTLNTLIQNANQWYNENLQQPQHNQ